MILVTGGAGFIGSNFVIDWLAAGGEAIVTSTSSRMRAIPPISRASRTTSGTSS